MEARIIVGGSDADVESLWDWLRNEAGLRGSVKSLPVQAPEGTLGVATELVVALVATPAGSAAAVLARALSAWLTERERQQRSDVSIQVTGPDGRQVSVSAKRAPDSERILRLVLEPEVFNSIEHPASAEASQDE